MSDPLAIYLHDHLAGSRFAVELLDSLEKQYRDQPLGSFAAVLRVEVEEDQQTLKRIIERVGTTGSDLKDAAAWFTEKATRLKLQRDNPEGLGTFEALEALQLGIGGKLALWRALPVIAETDARIARDDYEPLAQRAERQQERLERVRLETARRAFRGRAA